jgi:hypothetical protein
MLAERGRSAGISEPGHRAELVDRFCVAGWLLA